MEAKTIDVILTALIQTDYETYTHVYKSVPVEIPNDGIDWHVAGEEHKGIGGRNVTGRKI